MENSDLLSTLSIPLIILYTSLKSPEPPPLQGNQTQPVASLLITETFCSKQHPVHHVTNKLIFPVIKMRLFTIQS